VRIVFPGASERHKTLIFVLSPSCGVCRANWPNWRDIRVAAASHGVRQLFVDTSDELSPVYLSQHAISDASVVTNLSARSAIGYRFGMTPQTILVSEDGVVAKVWTGLLSAGAVREIENTL